MRGFLLRITDNGEGFHPPTSHYSGMGLKIMKYRAGMIGAKFEIAPGEPRGTVVRVVGEQPQTTAELKPAWRDLRRRYDGCQQHMDPFSGVPRGPTRASAKSGAF